MVTSVTDQLAQIADAWDPNEWVLVGGLMVHLQAERAAIVHHRPTNDVDIVVEIAATTYTRAAHLIEGLGFVRHESIDATAPFHRFVRDDEIVDLMAPSGSPVRFARRRVVSAAASAAALREPIWHQLPTGQQIRLPQLPAALAMKGAALETSSPSRVRHLQDAVTLFACVGDAAMVLSKSMRAHVNRAVLGLGSTSEAWANADLSTRRAAIRAIRRYRPDWVIPDFALPKRV